MVTGAGSTRSSSSASPPGILGTTSCVLQLLKLYADRIYTTGIAGPKRVLRIDGYNFENLDKVRTQNAKDEESQE